MSQSRAWRRDWPLMLILLILAIVTYIPFVFTVINSFKINAQFFQEFWLPTLPLHPENYRARLARNGQGNSQQLQLLHTHAGPDSRSFPV